MYTDEGFCTKPDEFYTPKISISPYNLKGEIDKIQKIDGNFFRGNKIFEILGKNVKLSKSGKDAIVRIFNESILKNAKLVAIVTESGNTYVSRCVTNTLKHVLEKRITNIDEAEVIYIIHEFGRIISEQKMGELRKLSKPVINDFAYSFCSLYLDKRKDFNDEINFTSLPKTFPMNNGGLYSIPDSLKSRDRKEFRKENDVYGDSQLFTDDYIKTISKKRQINLQRIINKLQQIEAKSYWPDEKYVPGVAMITTRLNISLENLKAQLNRVGIESSVFYGERAFFVPVHQNLTELELEYITSFVKYYATT
jgi:hypothetical protein